MTRAPATLTTHAVLPIGGTRAVLEASVAADGDAALAVVLETSGSTYVRAGALALFDTRGGQTGWLSGGCLEPEIAQRALAALHARCVHWMEIDTHADEDLLSGSAVGCRGRLRLALIPLAALPAWPALVAAWRDGAGTLELHVHAEGRVEARIGVEAGAWKLDADAPPWTDAASRWSLSIAPMPSILVLGAGPETPVLLPMLRALGAHVTLAERRPRWRMHGEFADVSIDGTPTQALATRTRRHDAALVMHHHFELDREALAALADAPIGFVGLLGPVRRRDDLFRVLPAATREALLPRLHSPIGLHLGGSGPEAIALSIAAQLQRHLHGVST